ncbi:VCBS repeat-containing protein [Leptolyngbya cf. ectocarpi LEGE 11479]|uniref:VCBS repeat-containing protein n=1 Tax=Leptolyngbya cf. ectocarpi LEGE 11479 TaxID=1828722 RepID=A0A928ZXD4_LEPEC|nr:VCBS repeat-containing protein [Leptolyngbya ectocarpi]MBE9069178.1 VCBS repeat-containing protein [Leptolyngbya cf. ectocarpi LEGE 11479]
MSALEKKNILAKLGIISCLVLGSSHVAFASQLQRWANNFGYEAGGWRISQHVRTLADVNGDGKDDIVGFGNAGTFVSLSTGSKFQPYQMWIKDFGRNTDAGSWNISQHIRTLADVNGDGKDDIVGFGNAGTFVSLSTGSGFASPQMWVNDFGNEGGWLISQHIRTLADVNGDGKDDIVGFGNAGTFVALSTGSEFASPQMWVNDFGYGSGEWQTDQHVRTLADVNGDGKDDIIGFGNAGTFVALSTGTGFNSPQMWVNDFGRNIDAGSWNSSQHIRTLADVNGDGKDDIVGFGNAGTFVALSTGTGFNSPQMWVDNFGYETGGWRINQHIRTLVDVNGDGKDDIVGFGNAGTFVSLSTGSGFNSPQTWINNFGRNADAGSWDIARHIRTLADVNGDGKGDIVGFGNTGVFVMTSP